MANPSAIPRIASPQAPSRAGRWPACQSISRCASTVVTSRAISTALTWCCSTNSQRQTAENIGRPVNPPRERPPHDRRFLPRPAGRFGLQIPLYPPRRRADAPGWSSSPRTRPTQSGRQHPRKPATHYRRLAIYDHRRAVTCRTSHRLRYTASAIFMVHTRN